jgi:hypothetical protein
VPRIAVKYDTDQTEIKLFEKKRFKAAAEVVNKISIPLDIRAVQKIDDLGQDYSITPELVLKCRQFFAYYIKKRLGTLTCFYDYALTMKKIALAAEAIRSCDAYAEQTLSSEGLKATITEIFQRAIGLEAIPGDKLSVDSYSSEKKQDYPGGFLGCFAKEAFRVFNHEIYVKMVERDSRIEGCHREYLATSSRSEFFPGVD